MAVPLVLTALLAGASAVFLVRRKRQQEDAEARAEVDGARAADMVVKNPTFVSPVSSAARQGTVVVVGSNQQQYIVPMLGEEEEAGGDDGERNAGNTAVGVNEEGDYMAPCRAQAEAYELRQVPGARDHRNRNTNQIYSRPQAPPPPALTAATAAAMDYTYIDEDVATGEVEYATAVDGAQRRGQQILLDGGGYVEGGAVPGNTIYAQPVGDGGRGGRGGRLVLDAGGYVAGSELKQSSLVYAEANSNSNSNA